MPWLIGIDEAGYGPNLGPLVQSAVGATAPNDGCLWKRLATAVRRSGIKRYDRRLTIDDSKKVYISGQGLANLEIGVLATLLPAEQSFPLPLNQFLERVAPAALVELRGERWFSETESLPVAVEPEQVAAASERFHARRGIAEVGEFWTRCRVTPAALFNTLLDGALNKADILAHGLSWLLRESRHPDNGNDPVIFAIDRQGGRRYHEALLAAVCPDGWVKIVSEDADCCRYRLDGRRQWHWSFEVEADSHYFTVALASMLSKYVREVLMSQFNRFWLAQVPGLKPTAGYPTDASRFYDAIRPAMQELGIAEATVWRRR
jgi:ribonuclease HII